MYAALTAVLRRYRARVVTLTEHDLGIAAAVIGILQIVDRISQRVISFTLELARPILTQLK